MGNGLATDTQVVLEKKIDFVLQFQLFCKVAIVRKVRKEILFDTCQSFLTSLNFGFSFCIG